ncbi:uncharacterized protein I206_107879 [Kwoniella pini CBS 10737]|uniref:Uncharacterized protein n=1 Tax=Kwoniella pini CBS 10737 TaxID=1296096 RepID=A0A1B9HYI0_9TREE|nr:uncharacterized protein I206_06211 [Kwoniella pini CBS 10737]OCF48343.1 hypothetical protein I206_06211 [Kwoniella pini CBS 10737]
MSNAKSQPLKPIRSEYDATRISPPVYPSTVAPFFTEDCKKNFLQLINPTYSTSPRVEYYGADVLDQMYTRIQPPQVESTFNDQYRVTHEQLTPPRVQTPSPPNDIDSLAVPTSSNRPLAVPTSSNRPHDKNKWKKTYALRQWNCPTPPPSTDSNVNLDDILPVTIVERIHSGRTWDVFRGQIVRSDGAPTPIVIRFTNLETFPEDFPAEINDWDVCTQHVRSNALSGIINEDYIYRSYLPRLQGDLVPLYYGMFIWKGDRPEDGWMIVSILEDVGEEVEDHRILAGLPLDINHVVHGIEKAEQILERYENDENDTERRYIKLIDFQESLHVPPHVLQQGKRLEQTEIKVICQLSLVEIE